MRSASCPITAITRSTPGRRRSRAPRASSVSPSSASSAFGPPMRAPRPAARMMAWMRKAVGPAAATEPVGCTSGIITLHGMKQKHLVSLRDYTRGELEEVFDLARRVKADPGAYAQALRGKSLAMIFQKPSTRTRVSFEVGMFQLGGHALHLGANEIQIGRGETLADVGDGNNMCQGLMSGAVKLGVEMKVAAPSGYEPNQLIVKSAVREAQRFKTAPPLVTADPMEAVQGADVVYTDVWTSMGQ